MNGEAVQHGVVVAAHALGFDIERAIERIEPLDVRLNATHAGQHADAQSHLGEALALADACAAPYERALCLLALAELVSWWGVLVLPATVALMVKLNDVIAGALSRSASVVVMPAAPTAARAEVLRPATVAGANPPVRMAEEATTRLPGVINRERGAPIMRPWAEEVEARQWRVRQSATRRYE